MLLMSFLNKYKIRWIFVKYYENFAIFKEKNKLVDACSVFSYSRGINYAIRAIVESNNIEQSFQ